MRYEIHFSTSSATSQNLAFAQTRAALGLPATATNDEIVAMAKALRSTIEAVAAGTAGAAEAANVIAPPPP
jgi:hypothetical protein